jgi:hypothetical protein
MAPIEWGAILLDPGIVDEDALHHLVDGAHITGQPVKELAVPFKPGDDPRLCIVVKGRL